MSQIGLNNNKQLLDKKFQETLDAYNNSNQTDTSSKTKLIDFFSQEYITTTLFQAQIEVNYSERVKKLDVTLPLFSKSSDLYYNMSLWHTKTERTLK